MGFGCGESPETNTGSVPKWSLYILNRSPVGLSTAHGLGEIVVLDLKLLISTGTPAGVGFARKPPRWLLPGDEVAVQVEGIGRLVNPVVAEG